MRAKALWLASIPLLAVAVLFYLHFPSVRAQSSSAPPSAASMTMPMQPASTPQTYAIYAGLWRVDGNFVSTLRVKNELVVASLDVTPVLYMSDGTPYALPPVHVAVAGVALVNINDALTKVPAKIAGHLSQFGNVELHWRYTSAGHVVASVEMLNIPQSLIFIAPFNAIDAAMTGKATA